MKSKAFTILLLTFLFLSPAGLHADNGYDLWLRYSPVDNAVQKTMISSILKTVYLPGSSPTLAVIRNELIRAGYGLTGRNPSFTSVSPDDATLIIGTPETNPFLNTPGVISLLKPLGPEGFFIGYISHGRKKYLAISSQYSYRRPLRHIPPSPFAADKPLPAFITRYRNTPHQTAHARSLG